MNASNYSALLGAARDPHDLPTLAFAGVIAMAATRKPPYDVPIAGLGRTNLRELLSRNFPALDAQSIVDGVSEAGWADPERIDEFGDLVELLGEHANFATDECRWIALALATASMGENHLWQDMGLPDRHALSRLIEQNFTSLFIRNVGDMKWKKFFYRQLCEKAEVLICKSPSCGICVDFNKCFGSEELSVPGHFTIEAHPDSR